MHLKRYFCEAGQENKVLRDDVFIVSGQQWEKLVFSGQEGEIPRPLEYYASAKSIVLLGPPRQGKTSEFLHQCSKIQLRKDDLHRVNPGGPVPIQPEMLDPRKERMEIVWQGRHLLVQDGWPFLPQNLESRENLNCYSSYFLNPFPNPNHIAPILSSRQPPK